MKKLYIIPALVLLVTLANAQVDFSITVPAAVCYPGDCTDLLTRFTPVHSTANYNISAIPYSPSFPFSGGQYIPPSMDDVWSAPIPLPFTFSFYGVPYNQLLVGSNGVVTFTTTGWNPAIGEFTYCPWAFDGTIPNPGFPIKNAIYGVYQDTDITSPPVTDALVQNANYYMLDTGANVAPNRVFVINYNSLPLYDPACNSQLQTSQIVLHEGSNIIEVFVGSRTSCTATDPWNHGNGVIGIQNTTGTIAHVPPGRNTGTWNATQEAWQFIPSGPEINTTIIWKKDGVSFAVGSQVSVCPAQPTDYTATLSYQQDGNMVHLSDTITITPVLSTLGNPLNLYLCGQLGEPNVINLTTNTVEVLATTTNPENYLVDYYNNELDAQFQMPNNIQNAFAYSFTENETIYMSIENFETGCVYVKPFTIAVVPPVTPPTGEDLQQFEEGQTLNDIVVTGQNITWYDEAAGGNVLPASTVLQNNTTYYASQSINGCESKNANSARFAVTVSLVLGNETFSSKELSVYPNPANVMVTVRATENLKSVTVYNTIGQKVVFQKPDQKEVRLDVSNLPAGIYFVKASSDKKHQTVKILKN